MKSVAHSTRLRPSIPGVPVMIKKAYPARAVRLTAATVRRADRKPIWNMLTAPERNAARIRTMGTIIPTKIPARTV